jgi:transcriptional regulator with XRE-family HTH domain
MSDFSNNNIEVYSDPMILSMIGESLKRKRINLSITQEELARQTCLDRASIIRLESGKGATLHTFIRVLRMLRELYLIEPLRSATELTPIEAYELERKIRKKRKMRVRNSKKLNNNPGKLNSPKSNQ